MNNDIIKILDSSMDGSVKKKQLISLIYKNIDLQLFNMYQKGGDKFMEVGKDKEIDFKNFLLLNKRDLCKSNLNKDQCNRNDFCIYKSKKCKFIASKINVIKFVNKLVNELLPFICP